MIDSNTTQSHAALRRELEATVGGEIRFDRVSKVLYSTDASVYQIEPLGVVVPRSREDVVRTVEAAKRHGVSITPRGGGTSQAGQAIGAGLQLDFRNSSTGFSTSIPRAAVRGSNPASCSTS